MAIKVLRPEVAAKIAAGEVVERPSSAVKELIENSLDAGATQITVEVRGGGLGLVRVVDNGTGIPSPQVETAFSRHATSKISSAEDLERICTLGFRGEALYSIASVSQMEMATRFTDETAGTGIKLINGSVAQKGFVSRPVGTTVLVTRLFQNVPARLKFIKSPASENGRIAGLVSRFSLAHPSVRFNLTIDGKQSFTSLGTGSLKDAVARVYGPETAEAMVPVQGESPGAGKVEGFASPPSVTRAHKGYITLLVNRRWIKDRRLAYAVEEAYQNLLPVGRHPVAVLHLSLPPEDVDVNVHPAKSEVRFRHDQEIFSLVQRAVREALLESAPVPKFRRTPSHIDSSATFASRTAPTASELVTRAGRGSRPSSGGVPSPAPIPRGAVPILRVIGQVSSTYIVAEGPDGMYLVDQHAAHERVLFERVVVEQKENKVQAQGMLAPVTVELTPIQQQGLGEEGALLVQYGFAFEPFGEGAYILRAVPASLSTRNPGQTFIDILDSLLGASGPDTRESRVASSIACHSAVRAGDALKHEEMVELVRLLEGAENPHTCPHGRPTMVHLSSALLEKEFGRR